MGSDESRRGFVRGGVVGAVVALAAGGGVALAAIPSTSTGNISGCVNKTSGALRVIDAQAGKTCQTTETRLDWAKGWRWRGAWSATTAYGVLDVVTRSGTSYLARAASTAKDPATNPTLWGVLAQRGATGLTGPKGDQGSPGIQGIPGVKGDQGDPGVKGDQGDPGVKGDQGDPGVKGDQGDPGEQGPPGPGGFRGMKDFLPYTNGMPANTFVPEAGVTKVLVELWGAGGGGGCGANTGSDFGAGGGTGRPGSYRRGVVPVVPGETYTITVGSGGSGCSIGGSAATAGSVTTMSGPGLSLSVQAGSGGNSSSGNSRGNLPGFAGSSSFGYPNISILGQMTESEFCNKMAGAWGNPGTSQPAAGRGDGGDGGPGDCGGDVFNNNGQGGDDGYALITW